MLPSEGSDEVFGAITLVLNNSVADDLGLERGQVFRAVDDFFTDSTGLATLKTVRIKVVGPAPQNLTAESEVSGIRLFWDSPYLFIKRRLYQWLLLLCWNFSRRNSYPKSHSICHKTFTN